MRTEKGTCVFGAEHLRAYVAIPAGLEPVLASTVHHALDGGGSFGRANLILAIGHSLGLPGGVAEKAAASVELFHLASLVLDDLPCMDDAKMRRARPCAHVAFGEGSAILASLGFINRAYALLWELFCGTEFQEEAAALVERCLGLTGILDGQAKDIRFAHGEQGPAAVLEVARKKTGTLLHLCLLLPAMLAGSDRHTKLYLSRIAELWGMAYQVLDDLKDVYYGEGISGKTTQRDEMLGRPNLALSIGDDGALEALDRMIDDAAHNIQRLGEYDAKLSLALSGFHERIAASRKQLQEAYVAA